MENTTSYLKIILSLINLCVVPQNWNVLSYGGKNSFILHRYIFPICTIILHNLQTGYSNLYKEIIIVLYIISVIVKLLRSEEHQAQMA